MFKLLGKNVHQSWFVVGFCAGVVAGVVVGLVWRINYFKSPIWLGFCGLLLVVAFLKPKLAFIALAVVAGMVVAFFRISAELVGENYIREFEGKTILVTGVIDGDPETDESGTKIKMVSLKLGENETRGSIYISVKQNDDLARGDEVTVKGKLSAGFGTYAGYMYRPAVIGIKRPEPGSLVLKLRNWFSRRIRGLIPEPQVNLGLSYLLGMKSGLPDDLSENLRMVGLVHIVVASGAHLSILVEVARKIFGRISRFAGVLFALLFVVFFMAMVGFTPSILRAGIMSVLTLLAWYVGRKFAPWRIILIVMAITLMINPNFVINLGWLLSFASFAGIMVLGPRLSKFFYGEKKPGFIAEIIITTISATLMTLPIVLYFYGTISLISVVANLLILPTLGYAMGLIFLTGVVAGIPVIEMIVAWLGTRLLDFHIAVVEFFGGMKQFMIEIPAYRTEVFWFYLLIGIGLFWQEMVKLRQVKINYKREKLCQDIVNGQRPNAKKP